VIAAERRQGLSALPDFSLQVFGMPVHHSRR
jgi:hypothetical protein